MLLGHDPVDSWVSSDGVVSWINADDLEELVGGILARQRRGCDVDRLGDRCGNAMHQQLQVGRSEDGHLVRRMHLAHAEHGGIERGDAWQIEPDLTRPDLRALVTRAAARSMERDKRS